MCGSHAATISRSGSGRSAAVVGHAVLAIAGAALVVGGAALVVLLAALRQVAAVAAVGGALLGGRVARSAGATRAKTGGAGEAERRRLGAVLAAHAAVLRVGGRVGLAPIAG